MPRRPEVNRQIRDETTDKILEAARSVFARKGMATKMSEVAAAAGISQGLAYHYFPSKRAIFVALVRQMTPSPEELELTVQKIPGAPAERLDRMISSMVERRRADPEFYQFFSQAMADDSLPEDIRESMYAQGLHMQEILRRLIVEGQATGEIAKDDPDELLQAITACLDGLSRMALPSSRRIGNHLPDARIILRMLRPDKPQE
jgi:AcrR family transcriptional regulator